MILCPFKELGRYADILPGLEEALETIRTIDKTVPAAYPISCGKVIVQQGTTKPWQGALLEAHRQYLDIQYILDGQDVVGWAPVDTLTPDGDFNVEKDAGMYAGKNVPITVTAGHCYVVFPEDAHAPGKHLAEPNAYTKIIVKLKV